MSLCLNFNEYIMGHRGFSNLGSDIQGEMLKNLLIASDSFAASPSEPKSIPMQVLTHIEDTTIYIFTGAMEVVNNTYEATAYFDDGKVIDSINHAHEDLGFAMNYVLFGPSMFNEYTISE
jgi:hypothetical protein